MGSLRSKTYPDYADPSPDSFSMALWRSPTGRAKKATILHVKAVSWFLLQGRLRSLTKPKTWDSMGFRFWIESWLLLGLCLSVPGVLGVEFRFRG